MFAFVAFSSEAMIEHQQWTVIENVSYRELLFPSVSKFSQNIGLYIAICFHSNILAPMHTVVSSRSVNG